MWRRFILELFSQERVVRQYRAHQVPKAGAVAHHAQMTEFMHHHVVNHVLPEMHETPVQSNRSVSAGTTPTRAGVAQKELTPPHLQERRKVIQTFYENTPRLTPEPGLHRRTNLHWCGAFGQTQVQAQMQRRVGIATLFRDLRLELRPGAAQNVSRVYHDAGRCAENQNPRPVAPPD